MTIEEAKHLSMTTGKKIAHRFFSPDEHIIVSPDGTVTTEEGYKTTWREFMELRNKPAWREDWSVWTSPQAK